MAYIKNSGGNFAIFRREIAAGECDWRDVIGPAEYPQCKKKMFRTGELSSNEVEEIYSNDWAQDSDQLYSEWPLLAAVSTGRLV